MSERAEPNWAELRKEMGDNVLVEVSIEDRLAELRRDRRAMLAAGTRMFDETKVKRYGKGTKTAGKVKGGRFAPKETAETTGAPADEDEPVKDGQRDGTVVTVADRATYARVINKMNEPMPAAFEWPPPTAETDAALGFNGATDVRELVTVPSNLPLEERPYLPERLAHHDAIIAHFFAQSGMVEQEEPFTLFMAGGSGAGKSSILGKQLTDGSGNFEGGVLKMGDDIPMNAVYINPDDIKEMLPEYQAMIERGDPAAASFVHEESSVISKRLLDEANKRGYNVVLDGTGDSKVGKFYSKVQAAESLGRGTRVVLVDIPTEMAIDRAMKRAETSGRMVPESEIRLVHKNVSANFDQWKDTVDDWELWDNSADHDPKRVAHRRPVRTRTAAAPRYTSLMVNRGRAGG